MARLISEREVASVRLMTLEMSEDEVGTYALGLKYLLEHFDAETVEKITGAYRDEVEGILEDLIDLIDLDELEAEVKALKIESVP
jgi:hypothetical protein